MIPYNFVSRYSNDRDRFQDYLQQRRPLEMAIHYFKGVRLPTSDALLLRDALGMAVDADFVRRHIAWHRDFKAEMREIHERDRMTVIMKP
jgi:uncharacterized protein YbcC (UPF0753/DUF2309 family)